MYSNQCEALAKAYLEKLAMQQSAWVDFYQTRTGPDYMTYVRERYQPFLDQIRNKIYENDKILEIGCGTATISRIIYDDVREANWKNKIIASDINRQMLKCAKRRLKN